MNVFIVQGSTGEFSDKTNWFVAAALDLQIAVDLSKKLNAWCIERGLHVPCRGWDAFDGQRGPPDDPKMFRCDPLTGTQYSVFSVPMIMRATCLMKEM